MTATIRGRIGASASPVRRLRAVPASSLRSFGRLSAAEGAVPVLVAAAVAGAAGYLIGIVVPAAVAPASYAAFSLVWSAQFLTVSALSGVQQEVGRASAPLQSVPEGAGGGGVDGVHQVLSFARRLAVVVAFVAAVTAALLVWRGVLPGSAILPLTLGAAAFAVVAVLTGLLYGLGRTGVVALVVCCEWVLRCVLVVLALAASSDL